MIRASELDVMDLMVRFISRHQVHQRNEPVTIRQRSQVLTVEHQNVKDMQGFIHALAIHHEVTWESLSGLEHQRWQPAQQPLAIDAINGWTLLLQQDTFPIVFLLSAVIDV